MQNTITKEYDRTMKINIQLSQLAIEINKSMNSFDQYIKNRDSEDLQHHYTSVEKIGNILKTIETEVRRDKDSGIFFRNLENMFDYQKQLTDTILVDGGLNVYSYRKFNELRTLSAYMNNHAQMLITSYLDYTNQHYSNTLQSYKETERSIAVTILFFSFISFVFAIFLSNNTLEMITALAASAEQLAKGNWEVEDIKENAYQEFSMMAQAFNHMKNNIKYFVEELRRKSEVEINLNKEKLISLEKDKLLKESQLMTLQNQMDPHFLFNTLNIIARIAMFEGGNNTVRLIQATAKILRYNLSNKNKLVKLEEEISTLKAYIFIQETRFQDQITFELQIKGNIDDVEILPMTLQPIVENAIIHGLQDQEEGKIEILILREKNYVKVQIKDNGRGISEEKLKHIFKENSEKNKKGHTTGLGLSNVKKRLELHFGMENLIFIDSQVDQGTSIDIFIPLKDGEPHATTDDY
ncbi:sensor histidine kinase [Clostridium formicaceticum]|nr:sensor histidine kinase [Clostridium formicaceticum]